MENSLNFLAGFLSNLKIRKKSNFDQNQLKLATQHQKTLLCLF